MIYLFPFISALIGWFTNFLAIKMLFHPKKAIAIGPIRIQGIFPKRQKALAEKLGQVVATELFSIEDLNQQFSSQGNQEVLSLVEEKIDTFIQEKLPTKMPMLAMFLNDDIKNTIKSTLLYEIEAMLPELIEKFGDSIGKNIDIAGTVQSKVEAFSIEKLEDVLQSIMKKEFKFVEILGGIVGFIIGLAQVALLKFGN